MIPGIPKYQFLIFTMSKLHKAVREGQVQVVEWLIKSGDNIEERDNFEMTALHVAAQFGQLEVMKCLIEKGAEKDVKNQEGNTPLHEAVENGHHEVVKYLIEKGANTDVLNENNKRPLYAANNFPKVLKLSKRLFLHYKKMSSFEFYLPPSS